MAAASSQAVEAAPAAAVRVRIDAIDVLRGLVMVLMALDHTRDFMHFGSQGIDATDPAQSNPALFATRWITHLCAPTFVMLSGVSVWLRRAAGTPPGALSGFLVSRGLWLILLEVTVVGLGFTLSPGTIFLQVIWAIGGGMILLAALTRLRASWVLTLGVAIIAGHNLLDPIDPDRLGVFAPVFIALHAGPTPLQIGPFQGVILYTLLAWFGVMCVGFGLGPVFRMERGRRTAILTGLGLAMIALFVALRLYNHYGDPQPVTPQPTAARAVMAFLQVSKYPPSLDYVLATLGPMLVLLPWLERWTGKAMEVLRTFGRVPLFYYVLHIYLVHGIAVGIGLAQGFHFHQLTGGPIGAPKGFGVSLPVVYAIWIAVVAALYPLCRWFEGVRQRRRDWWLSYL
jgi:uncharacterized membrane protein